VRSLARRILFFGSAVLAAMVLGLGSAWWAVGHGISGGVQSGAWRHDPLYGSTAAGPYVRAQTQLAGPLALDRSEAIYFVAATDDTGRALRPDNSYRIEGRDFDARWWSITVYGADHHLIPNRHDRYSYHMANLARNRDGGYTIHLSSTERSGNWIPTGSGNRFELFLRLYNPAPAVMDDPGTVDLPRIIREGLPDE
jgi:hypothetical protein